MTSLDYTVREMVRLATTYTGDVAGYDLRRVSQVFDFVRRIPYVPDKPGTGYDEALKRPAFTINQGGDCDDKAILAASALENLGVPWRFVTASYSQDHVDRHVYLEVYDGASWRPFDATYENNTLYTERPYTHKKVWNVRKTENMGIVSLEGSDIPNKEQWIALVNAGVKSATGQSINVASQLTEAVRSQLVGKLSAIASSAIAIPGVGFVVAGIIGALASFLRIRGKTQHLTYDEAFQRANDLAKQINAMYAALPQDGKDFMYQRAQDFLKVMLEKFGTWWGGAMNAAVQDGKTKGYYATPARYIDAAVVQTATIFLWKSDLEMVQEQFQKWYVDNTLTPTLLKPTSDYVENRASQLLGAGTLNDLAKSPASWAVAGGLLLMIASLFRRKGK